MDHCQGSATAGIVDDVTDDALTKRRVSTGILSPTLYCRQSASQTASRGGILTTLWVQLFQAQGQSNTFHHMETPKPDTSVSSRLSKHYLDVSVSLSIVDSSEGGLALPMLGVSSEHGPSALSLGSDHTTHL